MPKKWTELNQMGAEIERKKTITVVRQILSIVNLAAESATTFKEFSDILVSTITEVDEMLKE